MVARIAGASLEEEAMTAARWVLGLAAALLWTGCNDAGHSKGDAAPPAEATVPAAPGPASRVFEMLGPPFDDRAGDGDDVREDPDHYPAGTDAVKGAPDFTFRLAQGGTFEGQNILEIGPLGRAEMIFRSKRGWVHADFQLTAAELAGLQRELVDLDVYGLKAVYRTSATEDGTSWMLQVQAAGQRKEVWCANAFPEAMVRLSYYVRTRVVEPHGAALEQGEILTFQGPYHPPPRWTKGGVSREGP